MNSRQIFLRNIAQTSPSPLLLEIERAEGIYMYGPDGTQYIDLISGISVSNIGHCHPEVVEAVQIQSAKFMHVMVYGEYVYSPQVALGAKLASILPASLDNYYFTNSGTEAVEGALKLAKRYTGRGELISYLNAYHGSTAGALSIMGSDIYQTAYRPLVPDSKLIRYNELEDLNEITHRTAAVIVEMVQAEAGIIAGKKAYIQALRKRCTEVGALMIIDEIQTGCGRTGKLFAYEHYNIVPDILLLGKGFGGGMPIAAFISSKEIMKSLSHDPILGHISTFGGNPVCCAAALATLNVLTRENIIQDVERKGKMLEEGLKSIGWNEIRRVGLMLAVDFEHQEKNFSKVASCIALNIVTDWFLFNTHSMRICPPLIITDSQIIEIIELLKTLKD